MSTSPTKTSTPRTAGSPRKPITPKKPKTPRSYYIGRKPQPKDLLDVARDEVAQSEQGRKLQEEEQRHWDQMLLAGNQRYDKVEGPLKKCQRDTDKLLADIRGLEAKYASNERKRIRDAIVLVLVALIVGGLAAVVIGSIVHGIVISKSKK